MLKPEAAQQQLQQWRTPNEDAEAADRHLSRIAKLPKTVRGIAHGLLDRDANGKEVPWKDWQEQEKRRHRAFSELDALNAGEREPLLRLFFPRFADAVEHGWQLFKRSPYQKGYTRKSFRAPNHPEVSLPGRGDWLRDLMGIAARFQEDIVTGSWLAAWAPHLDEHYGGDQDVIGRLLWAVLDAGGAEADQVFAILTDSARGEHEVGAMGRHVTRGLLCASRPEGWEFMEKMLLAAQRQEGLRQAIVETIDEAHPEAFRRMLRLIIEHDLARFSSVVRALNVWLGYQWDSASVRVVNQTIEKVLRFLEDDGARSAALRGKSAEDVFLALWTVAYHDAFEALPLAGKLLKHAKVEHRYAAVLHLCQLGLDAAQAERLPALDDQDLRVAVCALEGIAGADEDNEPDQLQPGDDLFERLERLYARLPAKPTMLKPLVWPWATSRIDRDPVAGHLVDALGHRPPTRLIPYLAGLNSWQRSQVIELLGKQKKWDKLTRETLLDLVGDSSADVRQAAVTALGDRLAQQPPLASEAERLESYLTRKASDLRRGAVGLLLKQQDAGALASADRLLSAKDANQRLAGLELLRQLAEAGRERTACQDRAAAYQAARKKLSKEEQTQLDAIRDSGREKITLDNALGLMNPAERSPVVPPKKRDALFITDAAIACLKSLDALIHEHHEQTVRIETYEGPKDELLGNIQWGFPSLDWKKPLEQNREKLPLREIWEQWRDQRPKAQRDRDGLELVRAAAWADLEEWDWRSWKDWAKHSRVHRTIMETLSGGKEPVDPRYPGVLGKVLQWLIYFDQAKQKIDPLLDALEDAYARVPEEWIDRLVGLIEPEEYRHDEKENPDWREGEPFEFWVKEVQGAMHNEAARPTAEHWARFWQLQHWLDEPTPGARRRRPSLSLLQEAYAIGAANQTDWYDQLLGPRELNRWGTGWAFDLNAASRLDKENNAYFGRFPEVRRVVDACRERIVDIELARGEEATAATRPALELGSVQGIDTLVRILTTLGKHPFKVESYWQYQRRTGRLATLTHLASIAYPNANETPADFAAKLRAAVQSGHVTHERILELAFLAPQWCRFIEAYLEWDGFAEGLYWLLAHMKYAWGATEQAAIGAGVDSAADSEGEDSDDESGGNKLSAWDRLILERTPLSDEERRAGAVDVGWFQRTYARLTPARWEAMAAAARFAATPNQARRAQLVADVLLGKASRKELIASIRSKKLKDYVRLLGLLPLATGGKRDADLMERYEVLQEYRRYAKQLSAMTKDDALRSVDVGLQNLARTAGYPDPLRLEWSLESDSVKDLARGPVQAARDGVTVTLSLDDRAQPQLTVSRGDKELKSIPPAVKKDKKIAALAERVTDLKRKSSRMRQSLEAAMCRGDSFSGAELAQLCQHAILAPLLERLVLVGDGIAGYPDKKGKALRNPRGKLEPVKKNEALRIAHPHDLLQTGHWHEWQHECFAAERVQPFKQVFRELYLVTKQEKSDGKVSRRYAGQQVQPKQAYALWGQRGWSTRDGVWKTIHDLGITAGVDFQHGITTPLEVEGLTLDTVTFFPRDSREAMKLADVQPRVFSEVMRDLDLVVSVAHRGGVDPEASASTVEMRAGLLRETCQLLRLDNVRLKDAHAIVQGELGKYSVHLGSATVHKLPGGALCIVPVHAQHRGRLFLPFADDDPRTAEVISKVLLLARDQEIQDPTLLDQLRAV